MPFRFQIDELWPARPEVLVLVGKLLEGEVRQGDPIRLPLREGGSWDWHVLAIVPDRLPNSLVDSVSTADGFNSIQIAIVYREQHRKYEIVPGIATRDGSGATADHDVG